MVSITPKKDVPPRAIELEVCSDYMIVGLCRALLWKFTQNLAYFDFNITSQLNKNILHWISKTFGFKLDSQISICLNRTKVTNFTTEGNHQDELGLRVEQVKNSLHNDFLCGDLSNKDKFLNFFSAKDKFFFTCCSANSKAIN